MEERLLKAKSLAAEHPDEALRICNEIMNEDMDGQWGQMALFMSGYLMMEAERYGLAYHIYERCAQLAPHVSEIYSNMGMCLEDFDPYKAIRMFQKGYQLDPKNARAMANEGLLHLQTAKPDQCIKLSRKALEIDPQLVSARHNMGLAQLMSRDWKNGWKNYFDTLGVKHRERRDYGLPEWNGEEGTVLVYGEQGVGDEIMFASCIPDLMQTNDVIIDCDSRLEGLFKRSFGCPVYGTRFKTETPILDNYKPDYQCAMGQLPHFYRNEDNDFPGKPYLTPNPERCVQWRALFDTMPGKKIGVAWSGGLNRTGKKKRSLHISDIEQLLDDENTFISLEYKQHDEHPKLHQYQETLKGNDIDLLAAMISELDLVVTACTTVVYIAGALGVPCHVLVPSQPGYRYHTKGTQFDWYDSVKLFRQKDGEPWAKTVERYAKSDDWLRSSGNGSLSCVSALNTG
jgi:hypothetical protein